MSIIKDGLELPANKDGRVEIPNCGRRDLPAFFKEMGFKVGVEIGVQRGFVTRRLCRAGLKVYGIDPWLSYGDYLTDGTEQMKQEALYNEAIANTMEWRDNCILIKRKSMDALEDFEDESLDFIYIDGHHGFKYVTGDIFEWTKKIKTGGIISGHDYAYSHRPKHWRKPYILQVNYVIDAYTKAFQIDKWYVLGAHEQTFEGEKRDRYRSWMWFKTWRNEE